MAGTGREFIQKTTFRFMGHSDQMQGIAPPPMEIKPRPAGSPVVLPAPDSIKTKMTDLRGAIESRRSVRSFTSAAITLQELSFTLWCIQGVQEIIPPATTLRTVPSAGARHALETFILAGRVQGLPRGLYHYDALAHGLTPVNSSPDIHDVLCSCCLGQPMVMESAAAFFWAADIYRMSWRYGERGYRYIFLDAGHACQNLYLWAETIGCGVCAIAAFLDDELNSALGINGTTVFAVYAAVMGKR